MRFCANALNSSSLRAFVRGSFVVLTKAQRTQSNIRNRYLVLQQTLAEIGRNKGRLPTAGGNDWKNVPSSAMVYPIRFVIVVVLAFESFRSSAFYRTDGNSEPGANDHFVKNRQNGRRASGFKKDV